MVVDAVHSRAAPAEAMPFFVYAASKTEQERAFFKWAKDNKPSFAVNSVLPNMNVRLSCFWSARPLLTLCATTDGKGFDARRVRQYDGLDPGTSER